MTAKMASDIFNRYLVSKGIHRSRPREMVLESFLTTKKHLTLTELHAFIQRRHPRIGFTTVYRAMKIIADAGIAEKVDFGDGVVRYEHLLNEHHHDHLVCRSCGKVIEVVNPEIEKLQDQMAAENQFEPTDHRLVIFGICRKCNPKMKG